MEKIDHGFFLAEKLPSGEIGKPVSLDDGIIVFQDFKTAYDALTHYRKEEPSLSMYRINVVFIGEVVPCQEN